MTYRDSSFYMPVQPQDAVADLMRRAGAVVLWTADRAVACEVAFVDPGRDATAADMDALVRKQQVAGDMIRAAVPTGWEILPGAEFQGRNGFCGQQFKVVPR